MEAQLVELRPSVRLIGCYGAVVRVDLAIFVAQIAAVVVAATVELADRRSVAIAAADMRQRVDSQRVAAHRVELNFPSFAARTLPPSSRLFVAVVVSA